MSDIDTAPVRNRPTATVRGIASLPVDADFASISIDIEFHHRFRSEAIELAALEVASFRSDFASSSLVRALRLGQMSVRQSRHWDSDTNTYVEGDWEASVRGHLEIATDDVDVVIAAIVDHPVTVGYVSWRLDDDNPAHREVRRLAVGRARDAAEDFASGAGLAVGAVIALADPELLGADIHRKVSSDLCLYFGDVFDSPPKLVRKLVGRRLPAELRPHAFVDVAVESDLHASRLRYVPEVLIEIV